MIRRGIWLSVWAIWAWLGVGLARQLPRELGAPVSQLVNPAGVECKPLGFIDDTHVLMTRNERDGEVGSLVCWDADNGLKLHEYGGIPPGNQEFGDWTSVSLRHRVAAVIKMEEGKPDAAHPALHLLDLRTGEWRKLSSLPWRPLAFHPRRRWLAASTAPDRERPAQVCVFDLDSGERLLEWTGEATARGADHVRVCHFPAGSGELLIVCDTFGDDPNTTVDQRVIHIDVSSRTVGTTWRLPQAYRTILSPAENGLMVMAGVNARQDRTDIVDHRSGNVEHSVAAERSEPNMIYRSGAREIWPAVLSPSGRTILSTPAGLRRLDGKQLWTPDANIETPATRPGAKSFIVTEIWKPVLKSLRLPYDWTTYAVRDLEDGRVLYRSWQRPTHECLSSDGRVGVGDDLKVYTLPPPINWLVLLVCQAILALPLLPTWVALRWRRKRRLGLAGATS